MKRRALTLVFLLLLLTALGAQDYRFEHIDIEIDVALDNSYTIKERILTNFSVPRHGIYREIPIRFGKIRTKVSQFQASVPYKQDSVSSNWVTYRLGSADMTVVGPVEYELSYTYSVGDDRTEGYDQFYYNLLGDGWQAPVDELTFTVRFPKPIDSTRVTLTGGAYGSTSQRGSYTISSDGMTIRGRATALRPKEAITLMVQMEEGYYSEVTPFVDWTLPLSLLSLVLIAAMVFHASHLFIRYGREELFVPVVRYDPPDGLTPLEVGYLADGVVDNKDLTSMLFYWADGGCITIEEKKRGEFIFTKVAELKTSKGHELKLFRDFFAAGDGSSVTLKQLKGSKFAQSMVEVKEQVRRYFTGTRRLDEPVAERKRIFPLLWAVLTITLVSISLTIVDLGGDTIALMIIGVFPLVGGIIVAHRYSQNWLIGSRVKRAIMNIALAILLMVVVVVATTYSIEFLEHSALLSWILAIVLVAAPFYLGVLMIVTGKRSPYAQSRVEEIAGYMEFIKAVEVPRLKLMVSSDPQLFYHVLGYAIVLNLEQVWARKFKTIDIPHAHWYVGYSPVRSMLFYSALSSRLNSQIISSALYTQARSGARSPIHSSFGSGGFSGGGFGGGGGGAW